MGAIFKMLAVLFAASFLANAAMADDVEKSPGEKKPKGKGKPAKTSAQAKPGASAKHPSADVPKASRKVPAKGKKEEKVDDGR